MSKSATVDLTCFYINPLRSSISKYSSIVDFPDFGCPHKINVTQCLQSHMVYSHYVVTVVSYHLSEIYDKSYTLLLDFQLLFIMATTDKTIFL